MYELCEGQTAAAAVDSYYDDAVADPEPASYYSDDSADPEPYAYSANNNDGAYVNVYGDNLGQE